MNFGSLKKRTLQSVVMKKADTANFCSPKKQTQQILVVLDTVNFFSAKVWRLQTSEVSKC